MERYCFTLDLVDDEVRIREYEAHHRHIWPEVVDSFHRAGILNVELYRTGNRLVMILDTEDDFSLDRKREIDESDRKVQEWETLMATYQQPLSWAKEGEKWILMQPIYKFNK